jgi:hypothetical protein
MPTHHRLRPDDGKRVTVCGNNLPTQPNKSVEGLEGQIGPPAAALDRNRSRARPKIGLNEAERSFWRGRTLRPAAAGSRFPIWTGLTSVFSASVHDLLA